MNLDKTSLWDNSELKATFKIASMFYSYKECYSLKQFFILDYLSNKRTSSIHRIAWLMTMTNLAWESEQIFQGELNKNNFVID